MERTGLVTNRTLQARKRAAIWAILGALASIASTGVTLWALQQNTSSIFCWAALVTPLGLIVSSVSAVSALFDLPDATVPTWIRVAPITVLAANLLHILSIVGFIFWLLDGLEQAFE